MATKAKETSVGKEKKAPSSNSHITSSKRITTKSSTTSSIDRPISSPSLEKQVPNYLRPTISSVRPESHSHSFKLPRSTDAASKATLNRRRSFDKPPSPSKLPKQVHHSSLSREYKALLSPGPQDRALPVKYSSVPIKTSSPSKPISERLSKTPKEVKTQPKSAKKSSPSVSPSTVKKVITSSKSTNARKTGAGTAQTSQAISVETEPQVKEAINEEVGEVEKVENNQERVIEDVSENNTPHVVDPEHEHEHEHDLKLEESNHVEAIDEKIIPTVPEEEEKEEKIEEEHKEDDNTNQDECNMNESHAEIDYSTIEDEVEVKQKEEDGVVIIEEDHTSEGGVIKEEEEEDPKSEGEAHDKSEGDVIIEENNKSETSNEELGVGEVTSEEVNKLREGEDEDEQVESQVKEEKGKQAQTGEAVQGNKKESPSHVSNDVIEETASKLLEARKNKVRALAGAFQSVIDYQTK
ncbi:hypothetical protein VNO77_10905 [Canavalia gladiata]|uniref:Calmodulin-binding domain-containing protein n=1 Tax=Canavalia gladiata TaxID=3824 RepID=A0AAN9QXE3_CANGL